MRTLSDAKKSDTKSDIKMEEVKKVISTNADAFAFRTELSMHSSTASVEFSPQSNFTFFFGYYRNAANKTMKFEDELNEFVEQKIQRIQSTHKKNSDIYNTFLTSLQNIIDANHEWVEALDRIKVANQNNFTEKMHQHFNNTITNIILPILKLAQTDVTQFSRTSFYTNLIMKFNKYQSLINRVFKANGRIIISVEDNVLLVFIDNAVKNVLPDVLKQVRSSFLPEFQKILDATLIEEEFYKDTLLIYELIEIQKTKHANIRTSLYNLECALARLRISTHYLPDMQAIQRFLEMNRNYIAIQIRLLEHLSEAADPAMHMWPSVNQDILRNQIKLVTLKASDLLKVKKVELMNFDAALAVEILPIIDVLLKGITVVNKLLEKDSNADDHSAPLFELFDSELFKQNHWVKFYVLINAIRYYDLKISNDAKCDAVKLIKYKKEIESQFNYLQDITSNLSSIESNWKERSIKAIEIWVSNKYHIHILIATIERAFLNLAAIFTQVDNADLQLRNDIILRQIKLIEMQNAVLDFVEKVCGENFVRVFVFRKNNDFVVYDAIQKNRNLAENGDRLNIIEGIALADVRSRNALMKLKLAAIPLEFLADQRSPQVSDYDNAISDELEKYLLEWEKQAKDAEEQERALQEKQRNAQRKKNQNRNKLAAKKAEKDKAAAKKKEKEAEPSGPLVEIVPKAAPDPLAEKMNELLPLLNPRQFSSDAVKRVINELAELTPISTNGILVFKALSAIGDSYSMIAGHRLNSQIKNQEQLLATLKLALNYYSQADVILRNLDKISTEEHSNYYTWLYHSICVQQQLLTQYVAKFTRQRDNMLATKERIKQKNPEKWYSNHTKPGWHESGESKLRKELTDALNDATAMQVDCNQLASRVQRKVRLVTDHQTYAFEHCLAQGGKRPLPEQELLYKLQDEVTHSPDVVVMTASNPDADGVIDMIPSPNNTELTYTIPTQIFFRPKFVYKGGTMYVEPSYATEYPIPEEAGELDITYRTPPTQSNVPPFAMIPCSLPMGLNYSAYTYQPDIQSVSQLLQFTYGHMVPPGIIYCSSRKPSESGIQIGE